LCVISTADSGARGGALKDDPVESEAPF
jgi:hypothetical protein